MPGNGKVELELRLATSGRGLGHATAARTIYGVGFHGRRGGRRYGDRGDDASASGRVFPIRSRLRVVV